MSPKSLLRHPRTTSSIDNIFKGGFQEVLDDTYVKDPKKVKRILFCSGKIAFEMMQKQEDENRHDIAIVRVEQIYPIPFEQIDATIKKYAHAEHYWVQEESLNMGAWSFILNRTYQKYNFKVVARKNSASPATGFKKQHLREQKDLMKRAFGPLVKKGKIGKPTK